MNAGSTETRGPGEVTYAGLIINKLRSLLSLSVCLALFVLPAAGPAASTDRPKITVGGDRDDPPYEFLENGKPTGFDIELIQAAANAAGFDTEIRLGPWNKVRQDLEDGRIDAVAGMYYSPERNEKVEFSVPHTMASPAILVREGSPIRSFKDIRGKEIIVQKGDVIHDFLKKEGLASIIITVTDVGNVLKLLASGKHDCAFIPSRLQGEYFIEQLGLSNLRMINVELPPLRYCFAVTKGNRELLFRLDEGLNILKTSGQYTQIYEKWFGVYEKADLWKTLKYFAWALAIAGALLMATFTWSRFLQRQVNMRTAELRKSEDDLRKAHADLERRVGELKSSREQLRGLYAHMQSMREEERSKIAREVHDELGQMLTALKIDLTWIKGQLSRDQQPLFEKIGTDMNVIDDTIGAVKRICTELRPGILDHLGLGPAIQWQAREFQKRTGIVCRVSIYPDEIDLDSDRRTAIFRIFQEALTNVLRHARATEIAASLSAGNDAIVLGVSDNGIGITEEQLSKPNSFGLLGMRERAYQWGGEVTISSPPCNGTKIKISIPVRVKTD